MSSPDAPTPTPTGDPPTQPAERSAPIGHLALAPQPPERNLPIGRIVILILVVGLVAWTAVRIRSATAEQARLLVDRNEAAELAKKERKDRPLVLRAGVAAAWRPLVHIEGTLSAAEEADLGFKVPGRVASIRVKVGDYVHRGQTLATLEQTEVAASLEQVRAQVRASEAQLKLAEDTEARTAALLSSGAGSQQAALQSREQRALAAAQTDAARAALSLAQANLSSSTLTAPFAGYVTRVPSGAGQIVTSMGTVLFHVQNTAELKLVGTVSEADAGLIHTGETVRVLGPDGAITGTISAVLGSVDAATRRVPIEARLPNDPKHPLLAGSYVRAEVEGKTPIPALRFPAGVIRPGSQNEVMVASNGRLAARVVVFHPGPDGTIYVRAGLDANDSVVVDPSPEAKDGDLVPAGSQAPPAAKPTGK